SDQAFCKARLCLVERALVNQDLTERTQCLRPISRSGGASVRESAFQPGSPLPIVSLLTPEVAQRGNETEERHILARLLQPLNRRSHVCVLGFQQFLGSIAVRQQLGEFVPRGEGHDVRGMTLPYHLRFAAGLELLVRKLAN